MIDHKLENQKVAVMYEQVTDWNLTPQVSATGVVTVVMKLKLPYKESSVIMQMSEKDLDTLMQQLAQCKQGIVQAKASIPKPNLPVPGRKPVPRRRTPQGKAKAKARKKTKGKKK